ncbi:MAG: diguanylate cyclase, partial [Chryseobacterium sp.]
DLEDQDSLTRLYNLSYVTSRLEKEIRHSERFHSALSFLIVSVESFQMIAQTKGATFMVKALQQLRLR